MAFGGEGVLSIFGLYGRISRGMRGGELPCSGCLRFESAYDLQLVNLTHTYKAIRYHPIFVICWSTFKYKLLWLQMVNEEAAIYSIYSA
jgi:hypothetical protein